MVGQNETAKNVVDALKQLFYYSADCRIGDGGAKNLTKSEWLSLL